MGSTDSIRSRSPSTDVPNASSEGVSHPEISETILEGGTPSSPLPELREAASAVIAPSSAPNSILTRSLESFGVHLEMPQDFAAAEEFFHQIQLAHDPAHPGQTTITGATLNSETLATAFQHYQTLFGLHDSDSIFHARPPAFFTDRLRALARLILRQVGTRPDFNGQLEDNRLLASVFSELAHRGDAAANRRSLETVLHRRLGVLQEHPVSVEQRIQDFTALARLAREHGLEAFLGGELRQAIDAQVAQWREVSSVASHQQAFALLQNVRESFGDALEGLFQDVTQDLEVDARNLEQGLAGASVEAQIRILGELAVVHRVLANHPETGAQYRDLYWGLLERIAATVNPESSAAEEIPAAIRNAVLLQVAQQFESSGRSDRAAEIREPLLREAGRALRQGGRNRLRPPERLAHLQAAYSIYQQIGSAVDQETARNAIHGLIESVVRESGDAENLELRRATHTFAVEAYLSISDASRAQPLLEQIHQTLEAITDVDERAQWLLRLGDYAQHTATLRAETTETEPDFSEFNRYLGELVALGESGDRPTMALYGRFMQAIMGNDPAAAQLYRELQDWRPEEFYRPDLAELGAIARGEGEYQPDGFQQMAVSLWERQRFFYVARQSGPTLGIFSQLIEAQYSQRLAIARDEGQDPSDILAERDRMRGYLAQVTSLLSSGRAASTREAILMLPEATGEADATRLFFRHLGGSFIPGSVSAERLGRYDLVERILALEEEPSSNIRAAGLLSLAREIVVVDSVLHRHDALVGQLLLEAERSGEAGIAPRSLLEILRNFSPVFDAAHRLDGVSPSVDLWSELYNRIAGNETLREQIEAARDVSPYVQTVNQILDNVFSVEGGAMLVASIFTGGLAAALAEGAALAEMGSAAYVTVNGVTRLSWGARAALGATRMGAAFVARSATELGGIAAYRLARGRRQMNYEELRQRMITSLFSSIGDEVAAHLTKAVFGNAFQHIFGHSARGMARAHAATEFVEFFTSGFGEMFGEDAGNFVAGSQRDTRPLLVRYFEECFHGSFFVLGDGVGHGLSEHLIESAQDARVRPAIESLVARMTPEGLSETLRREFQQRMSERLETLAEQFQLSPEVLERSFGPEQMEILSSLVREMGYEEVHPDHVRMVDVLMQRLACGESVERLAELRGFSEILNSVAKRARFSEASFGRRYFERLFIEEVMAQGWGVAEIRQMMEEGDFHLSEAGIAYQITSFASPENEMSPAPLPSGERVPGGRVRVVSYSDRNTRLHALARTFRVDSHSINSEFLSVAFDPHFTERMSLIEGVLLQIDEYLDRQAISPEHFSSLRIEVFRDLLAGEAVDLGFVFASVDRVGRVYRTLGVEGAPRFNRAVRRDRNLARQERWSGYSSRFAVEIPVSVFGLPPRALLAAETGVERSSVSERETNSLDPVNEDGSGNGGSEAWGGDAQSFMQSAYQEAPVEDGEELEDSDEGGITPLELAARSGFAPVPARFWNELGRLWFGAAIPAGAGIAALLTTDIAHAAHQVSENVSKGHGVTGILAGIAAALGAGVLGATISVKRSREFVLKRIQNPKARYSPAELKKMKRHFVYCGGEDVIIEAMVAKLLEPGPENNFDPLLFMGWSGGAERWNKICARLLQEYLKGEHDSRREEILRVVHRISQELLPDDNWRILCEGMAALAKDPGDQGRLRKFVFENLLPEFLQSASPSDYSHLPSRYGANNIVSYLEYFIEQFRQKINSGNFGPDSAVVSQLQHPSAKVRSGVLEILLGLDESRRLPEKGEWQLRAKEMLQDENPEVRARALLFLPDQSITLDYLLDAAWAFSQYSSGTLKLGFQIRQRFKAIVPKRIKGWSAQERGRLAKGLAETNEGIELLPLVYPHLNRKQLHEIVNSWTEGSQDFGEGSLREKLRLLDYLDQNERIAILLRWAPLIRGIFDREYERTYGEGYKEYPRFAEDLRAEWKGWLPDWHENIVDALSGWSDQVRNISKNTVLRKTIPIHPLYHGKTIETVNALRNRTLGRLIWQGWTGGRPTPEALEFALQDLWGILPARSGEDALGHCLILNGHHRLSSLITLVADGYLPAETLEDVTFRFFPTISPAALLEDAFEGKKRPSYSWRQVMKFHPASVELLARQSGVADLANIQESNEGDSSEELNGDEDGNFSGGSALTALLAVGAGAAALVVSDVAHAAHQVAESADPGVTGILAGIAAALGAGAFGMAAMRGRSTEQVRALQKVKKIELRLGDENIEVRRSTVWKLSGFVSCVAPKDRLARVLAIEAMLGDESWNVRDTAVEVLSRLIPDFAPEDRLARVLAIEAMLGDEFWRVRRSAVQALGVLVPHLAPEDRLARTLLIEAMLEDEGYEVSGFAIQALGALIPHLAPKDRLARVRSVEGRVADEGGYERRCAVQALGALVPHLAPEDRLARVLAIEARLGDEDRDVRRAAVWALSGLVPHLTPEDRLARIMSIEARLGDEIRYVRGSTVKALGVFVPHLAPEDRLARVLAIEARLGDEDRDVRRAAVEALRVLQKHGAWVPHGIPRLLNYRNAEAFTVILENLSRLPITDRLPTLLKIARFLDEIQLKNNHVPLVSDIEFRGPYPGVETWQQDLIRALPIEPDPRILMQLGLVKLNEFHSMCAGISVNRSPSPYHKLRAFFGSLGGIVPIHNLHHGEGEQGYLETINRLRNLLLWKLLAAGWNGGKTTSKMWTEVLQDDEERGPLVSHPENTGVGLLLNGHHRLAALITLVADGYLHEHVLAHLPLRAAVDVKTKTILQTAFGKSTPPSFSWADVMQFHPPSVALLQRIGGTANLRNATHSPKRKGSPQ